MTERNEQAYVFWNSSDAEQFPDQLTVGGRIVRLPEMYFVTESIRQYFQKTGLLNSDGFILDLCGGATTGLYFGDRTYQTYVSDFSIPLLMRSAVPEWQRLCMDVGVESFNPQWENAFSVVTMIFGTRYLTHEQEKNHTYREAHRVLASGGRFILIDTESANEAIAADLGQVSLFGSVDEIMHLEATGFQVRSCERLTDPLIDDFDVRILVAEKLN